MVWDRATGAPVAERDQLERHPHRPPDPRAGLGRGPGPVPRPLRTAARDVLLRPQDPLAARPRAGPARARRGGRGAVRDDGHLADLEPHRPPRHRRHQRGPDDADEPRDARVGRRAARRDGRPARDAARDPLVGGGVRRGDGPARRTADRGRARRPARGAVRPDLLLARRGQVHVRDRQLHAAQHRQPARHLGQRAAHHRRLQDRRRAADVRARGLDRGHRRARAVVPRQPRRDRQRAGDRDSRAHASRTTAAATSCPPSPASSRRTGAATRAG